MDKQQLKQHHTAEDQNNFLVLLTDEYKHL